MRARAVGIIGGSGWIGSSIVRALLDTDLVDPRSLVVSGRSKLEVPVCASRDVEHTADNAYLAERSEVIILSVRPENFPSISIDAHRALVISVMAGVSIRAIALQTKATRIVRAMPNAAAELKRSYTPWFAAEDVGLADKAWVQAAFEACGTADEVASEADIEYLTGLTGSGPAFLALLADAMLSHAATRGLPTALSTRAVRNLLGGCSPLVARGAALPADIVDTFLRYRGTTAAGLEAMMAHGFVAAVHAGLAAAEATAVARSQSGIWPP